ncbi:hypothetical protein [Bradyrhizobium sp. ORS 285]|uniref:hypothetical protein n=1 Tax=Bradyrhizobium sp. ORS 285 TaxID=115808 RepID=UPI001111ED38|nr:hypothetical protein [Bradyrhizobium sp. ORS 285]
MEGDRLGRRCRRQDHTECDYRLIEPEVGQRSPPDSYRNPGEDAGQRFHDHVQAAIDDLKRRGIKPALLIVDTIFSIFDRRDDFIGTAVLLLMAPLVWRMAMVNSSHGPSRTPLYNLFEGDAVRLSAARNLIAVSSMRLWRMSCL